MFSFSTIKMWLLAFWIAGLLFHFRIDGNGSSRRIFKETHPFHPKLTRNSGRDNMVLFWPELNHSMLFFLQKMNLRLSYPW